MKLRAKILPYAIPPLTGALAGQALIQLWEGELLLGGLMSTFVIGTACNWLVLSKNKWRMPVRGNPDSSNNIHVKMQPHHRFTVLADIIPIGQLRISIGDILMLVTISPIVILLLLSLK